MIKKLYEVIKNRNTYDRGLDEGERSILIDSIISDRRKATEFANFFDRNHEELEAITAYLIAERAMDKKNPFHSSEFEEYMKGISDFVAMFYSASKERKNSLVKD